MKKLAVVLGVAAVATFTGCRDQDYDAKHGKSAQEEAKSIETTPAPVEVKTTTTVETTTVKTTEIKVEEPTTPAPVVTPKPAEPETTVYVVQNGDYLAKISKKYNVTINSIKRINNLKSDTIRVGQKLKLPGKIDVGVQAAPVTTATTTVKTTAKKSYTPYTGATKEYVVKNGDTLGSVAYGNGLNIRQLKQLNNLTSDSLKVGQKLKIPAEKTAKADAAKKAEVEAKKTEAVATKTADVEEKKAVAAIAQAEVAVKQAEVAQAEAVAKTAEAEVKQAEAAPATTTYVVQEGEDLTRIAVDFGVTPTVIRELNNLGENDAVKPGQVLKLPAEAQQ